MQLLQASIAHVLIKNITSASQQITARQFEQLAVLKPYVYPKGRFAGRNLEKPAQILRNHGVLGKQSVHPAVRLEINSG